MIFPDFEENPGQSMGLGNGPFLLANRGWGFRNMLLLTAIGAQEEGTVNFEWPVCSFRTTPRTFGKPATNHGGPLDGP